MKRLTASLLAAGLALSGNAFAQSSGYYPAQDDTGRYTNDGRDAQQGTYDYARVLRVDPVIGSSNRVRSGNVSRQCYDTRSDGVYVGNDPTYRNDGYYRDDNGYRNDGGYYGRDGYSGRDEDYGSRGSQANRTVATVIGGIAGAVLGSKIGNGSGSYVGTAVGSMVGGMAGRSIYDSSVRNRQYERRGVVRVCDPEPVTQRDGYQDRNGRYGDGYRDRDEELAGYDVTYEYANRTYHTRTNYHPGDRIRVRVDVQAE